MDEISATLADLVEQQANIANDSHDVDHAQIIEELNSFASSPDVDVNERLQHGLGKCTVALCCVINPFNDSCSKLMLFEVSSAILRGVTHHF